MKSVLFIINALNRAGAERVFLNQMNYLHAKGFPVFLALLRRTRPEGYLEELKLPKERIFEFRSRGFFDFRVRRVLKKIIEDNKIEVIYSTLEAANIMAKILKFSLPRTRLVIRESGMGVVDDKGRVRIKKPGFKILDIFLNWLPDAIIAVSGEMKNFLSRYQPFYEKKIKVLENGVAITESESEIRKRIEEKKNGQKFRVLSVASMNVSERAFEYLIEAIAMLPEDLRRKTEMVFVGDGKLRAGYEELAKRRGIADQVVFCGRLSTVEVAEEYKKADAYVLCSLSEGSPNVILEAMSYGVPIVTTPVGSAVNMVVQNENGFFVERKNAKDIARHLEWLAQHDRERLEMAMHSYKRAAERYSLDRKMEELITILDLR